MSRPWYEMAGGRKFVLSGLAVLTGYHLALVGKLTTEFVTICTIAVAAFSAANAFVTGKGTERKTETL